MLIRSIHNNILTPLGPDKVAGPDGMTAGLIQQHWDCFRGAVMGQIQNFFNTGRMESQIARSNIILIPKSDEPTRVGDFRPILVCNIIYKIIA